MRASMRKKNQGFSLFAVIVTVSFIGILAMLVLYLSVANFHMKTTGLAGTDSFYTAEQALEEVRTGLLEDVGNAMSEAYIRVLETYDTDNAEDAGAAEVTLDEKRQERFRKLYNQLLRDRLKDHSNPNLYDIERLRSYVDLEKQAGFDPAQETLVVTNPAGEEPRMLFDQKSGVLLKNLKVIYVDSRGRASVIQTDIRLTIPKIQFPTPSTLPDLMNMIVVANGGIICEQGAAGVQTEIRGSVSAGTIRKAEEAGGRSGVSIYVPESASLVVSDGDKLVCTGSVDVKTNGSFVSTEKVTLWASGVNLAAAGKVELLGKTYLSDDLTVESGSGSRVTLAGEYYGYGYPASAHKSRNQAYIETASDTALSSAILINGKNTVLDMSRLNKLMVAGKSYISPGKSSVVQTKPADILTGESLTVKGTQVAYLIPSELIGNGLYSNPMSYDDYSKMLADPAYGSENYLSMDQGVDAWGGQSLSQIGLQENKPCEIVFENHPQGDLVYFYLNFKNDGSASRFMQQYYKNNPELKAKMDRYLSFYLDSGAITLADEKNFVRYVTNGNVLESETDGTADGQSYAMRDATDAVPGENLLQEQIDYQNMWYALNRKMIGSCDLLKEKVADSEGLTHSELDPERSVFDNLVNEKEMVLFLEKCIDENKIDKADKLYTFSASDAEENLQAIMVNNGPKNVKYRVKDPASSGEEFTTVDGTDQELVITQGMAEKLRLVVSTGDVRIDKNVEFRGIIMAKGKITLGAGAKLISAPLEAARVFQAQNVEEQVSPKTFFWEGDKYVLGNTSSEGGSSTQKVSDVFSVSDCVAYENWRKR